ncbi:hypothetical protein TNCV_955311 [Trichonephila clavipes]|nr:hypothetical protein TNCV_955311 [Trichonephila clavipes]
MTDRGPRNSSQQRATCMPVVIRSFKHQTAIETGEIPLVSELFLDDFVSILSVSEDDFSSKTQNFCARFSKDDIAKSDK